MSGRPHDPREDVLPLVPQLRAYARALSARNPDLADDLVQDTLMLALQAWHRFTPGTNLKAWLFQILHNRFHSIVTRKHVRSEVASDSLERLAWVPAHQEAGPEVADFKAAFAHLSPSHREVLVLHAVHGLAYERIAEICGCEVGTVKSRINRARGRLKEMLLGEGNEAIPLRAPRGPTWRRPRASRLPPKPVRPAVIVRVEPPPAPAPIPSWRLPWLADAEREIARAEIHLTRHRQIVTSLSSSGIAVAGAQAALRLAEQRLTLLNTHRQRLLDPGARLIHRGSAAGDQARGIALPNLASISASA